MRDRLGAGVRGCGGQQGGAPADCGDGGWDGGGGGDWDGPDGGGGGGGAIRARRRGND